MIIPSAEADYASELNGETMIAFSCLDLKRIAHGAPDYSWPRPPCGRCGHPKIWGHGFVLMIFAGFAHALSIRVIDARPAVVSPG